MSEKTNKALSTPTSNENQFDENTIDTLVKLFTASTLNTEKQFKLIDERLNAIAIKLIEIGENSARSSNEFASAVNSYKQIVDIVKAQNDSINHNTVALAALLNKFASAGK